jgi:aryl-alcohol dehydrogenase-like predicted oxidoreductase
MRQLGSTDLQVHPLCLGGNVFGWTADEDASLAVLDAYAAAGGNFIDTADAYSAWVPGNTGNDSERIIGKWMAARGNRDKTIVATKVGRLATRPGLSRANILQAAEDSLRALQTDYIDLYYAHGDDDPTFPLEETMAAFDELVKAGKVRYVAASNYGAPRLAEALDISEKNGYASFVALQPQYNLVERGEYEGALADLCQKRGLACVPYFGLASGFLTGKYRSATDDGGSPRAESARAYLESGGLQVLEVLDEVAANHGTTDAAVALAWLAAQPTVVAPIASGRTPEQLADLLPMAGLELTADELAALNAVSRS